MPSEAGMRQHNYKLHWLGSTVFFSSLHLFVIYVVYLFLQAIAELGDLTLTEPSIE